jgi:hypothetical protein
MLVEMDLATESPRTVDTPRAGRRFRWVALAGVLTALDAAATALWLETGVAVEGNPLLDGLVGAIGAIPAMATRAVVGLALLVALALLVPRSRLARAALPAVTGVLGAVAAWHAVGGLLLV